MFDFFLDKAGDAGSLWWIPLFLWTGYFFWCRSFDYPADLERHIRKGRSWPYLPMFWRRRKLIRFVSLLLLWGGNIIFACALYSLFPIKHVTLLIIGIALATFGCTKIRSFATKKIIQLQRDRFFQIYTQMQNAAVSKGSEVTDSELLPKTQWQHQNDLRLADKQGRLMAFLKGEAKL
ncbi:MAG: hypothetical protein FWC15_06180 [Fibromonadales bacterium]|nr:hypothetical protein [Fibromonadales bacterium]